MSERDDILSIARDAEIDGRTAEAAAIRAQAEADSDRMAMAIYVVMARDLDDAIDMILECDDWQALDLLHKMLTAAGTERTDGDLNRLFVGPVAKRMAKLAGTQTQPEETQGEG